MPSARAERDHPVEVIQIEGAVLDIENHRRERLHRGSISICGKEGAVSQKAKDARGWVMDRLAD